jgi:hypothetical protein
MKQLNKVFVGLIIALGITSVAVSGSLLLNQLRDQNHQQMILDDVSIQNASSDPFSIESIVIDGDIMKIKVKYSGGTKEHDFTLIGGEAFMESYPVQIKVVLSHNANGDVGEKLITEDLNFDLSPLKQTYLQMYPPYDWETTITIKIRLESVSEPLIYQFDSNS